MNGRKWTSKEDTYLRGWYGKLGPTRCGEKLERTSNAVRCRAYHLGIQNGSRKGYVPLAWVDPKHGGRAHNRAVKAAKRDGVLERAMRRVEMYIVPEEWADKYAEQLGDEFNANREAKTWMRTKDVAAEAGLHFDTVTRLWKRNVGIGRYLRNVRTRMLTYPRIERRWHPIDTRNALREYRRNQT